MTIYKVAWRGMWLYGFLTLEEAQKCADKIYRSSGVIAEIQSETRGVRKGGG